MSKTYNLQKLFMSSMQVAKPDEREAWKRALRDGDFATVSKFLNPEKQWDFSPDVPATINGESPLKTIALAKGKRDNFTHHVVLADLLIGKGAQLRAPDKFGMFPADWAMLSSNRELAYRVVKETILQFHEHGRRLEYKPYVDPFFATCTDKDLRYFRYNCFRINHYSVGAQLLRDNEQLSHAHGNGYEDYISDTQKAYWSRKVPKDLCDMPYYTVALRRAEKTKQQEIEMAMGGVPLTHGLTNWMLDVEEAHDKLYVAQLRRLRELRAERRAMDLSIR